MRTVRVSTFIVVARGARRGLHLIAEVTARRVIVDDVLSGGWVDVGELRQFVEGLDVRRRAARDEVHDKRGGFGDALALRNPDVWLAEATRCLLHSVGARESPDRSRLVERDHALALNVLDQR